MRRPKGFGKNYFSLSAICAYSSSTVLHAQCSAFTQSSRNLTSEIQDEEDDPLEELELIQESSVFTPSSSCHCNCYFKKRIYILLLLLKTLPQTFFIYRKTRSGISPPFLTSTSQKNNK